ncbi:MAG TPA: hypothetical protein VGG83_05480 [Trebonia sp.]
MSVRYSHSASNGQPTDDEDDGRTTEPAADEGRSFTTGTGALVPPAADDEAIRPARPTFTAKPSEPAVTAVPAPAAAPDDTAADYATEPGTTVPAEPRPATDGPVNLLLGDADRLRGRWQHAQAGFVDDPREAVGEAADLIEQTAQALVIALRQQQRELRVMWEHGPADDSVTGGGEPAAPASDTEHLRLMMQRYRALFNQLCRP